MSIDTTAYDQFRQGIYKYKSNIKSSISPTMGAELTSSIIVQNTFGQPKSYTDGTAFEDTDKFNASVYINFVTGSDISEYSIDGAIEPLTIRGVVEFSSIDSPFEAHSIKCEFGNGNMDTFRGFDQVLSTFRYFPNLIVVPFEDSEDYMGGTAATSVALPGIISSIRSVLQPFVEDKQENAKKS